MPEEYKSDEQRCYGGHSQSKQDINEVMATMRDG
jgi:hypothetical protein